MNPRIDALILDLGGIVYKLDWTATNRVLGIDLNIKWWSWPEYDAYERGHLTTAGFQKAFIANTRLNTSFNNFEYALQKMIVAPLPGVEELLKRVRVPLYALSNTNHAHKKHFEIDSVVKPFKKVFASFEMGYRKPQPEIYSKAIQDIGVTAGSALFIDDREDNLRGAANIGLQTAHCLDDTNKLQKIFENHQVI